MMIRETKRHLTLCTLIGVALLAAGILPVWARSSDGDSDLVSFILSEMENNYSTLTEVGCELQYAGLTPLPTAADPDLPQFVSRRVSLLVSGETLRIDERLAGRRPRRNARGSGYGIERTPIASSRRLPK